MFICLHCQAPVTNNKPIGTKHRNHCPFCLYSRHVDQKTSGDRQADCQAKMKPIGLTFKKEGRDKWGQVRQGELMLIHHCLKCGKLVINRIAGDDQPETIIKLLENKISPPQRQKLKAAGIQPLSKKDRPEIKRQLFGK